MPIIGNTASGGKKPTTPTIGTATDGGTGTTVSVAFTPSTYIGKGTITYTATSSPGSLTGTGASSPITVSGLTTGTAYTFTVKGDTNYGVASDNSAASNSVTPASPSSFESIATFTGNGTVGTYTFSSIPSTYKSLQIRIAALGSASASMQLRINGDTTAANYRGHLLYSDGSTLASGTNTGTAFLTISSVQGLTTANPFVYITDIIDYASTSKNKTVKSFQGINQNTAANVELSLRSGLYIQTTAISSLTLFTSSGNFNTGTSIALYGVK